MSDDLTVPHEVGDELDEVVAAGVLGVIELLVGDEAAITWVKSFL